jgi:hypothetical protein
VHRTVGTNRERHLQIILHTARSKQQFGEFEVKCKILLGLNAISYWNPYISRLYFTGVMVVVNVAWLFSKFAIFLERYQPREPAVKVFFGKVSLTKFFQVPIGPSKPFLIVSAG